MTIWVSSRGSAASIYALVRNGCWELKQFNLLAVCKDIMLQAFARFGEFRRLANAHSPYSHGNIKSYLCQHPMHLSNSSQGNLPISYATQKHAKPT